MSSTTRRRSFGFGPFPLGHECVGTVAEVGPDCTDVAVGDVVGVAWHIACGTCAQCELGHTARCLRHGDAQYGLPVNGAWGGCFDELIRVPYADFNLVELPAGVDPVHLATLVGAGGVPYLALGRAPHGTALSGVDAAAAGVAFLLVLVRQTGHPRALPTSADLAAYRIIQEGLTLRSGFRMILQSEPDLEVVGEGGAVDPRVGAAVPFYGVIRGELPDFSGLKAEIQGHYAQTDVTVSARVPGDGLRAIIPAQSGITPEIHVHPAQHAFFKDSHPGVYHAESATKAWERTLEFLRERLG
ncbi:alcohol dehydrogenase catalytic domain-containing protein [Streptomyces sp. SS7]|uniref:alcohol dehydrogenase catalytic domain-containing protein n=1 Tax=Streptomyces sp. SS7 TaxID=3108485 RepID=UPI0030EB4680